MILLQKDFLLELLKTETVPVIGLLLFFLVISLFVCYKLYNQLNNERNTHQNDMAQLINEHKLEIQSLNDQYINALNENRDKLVQLIKSNEEYIKTVKYLIDGR